MEPSIPAPPIPQDPAGNGLEEKANQSYVLVTSFSPYAAGQLDEQLRKSPLPVLIEPRQLAQVFRMLVWMAFLFVVLFTFVNYLTVKVDNVLQQSASANLHLFYVAIGFTVAMAFDRMSRA